MLLPCTIQSLMLRQPAHTIFRRRHCLRWHYAAAIYFASHYAELREILPLSFTPPFFATPHYADEAAFASLRQLCRFDISLTL
jgi:hypothetical protein